MARLLVLLFGVVLIGLAVGVGSVVLDDGSANPILAPFVERFAPSPDPVDPADRAPRTFRVPEGAAAGAIGEELQRQNLIRSPIAFRTVVEQENVGNKLAAGEYELSRAMSTGEIVRLLASGRVKRGIIVTVPEGRRAEQIADALETAGFASREEFLRAVADPRSVPGVELLGDVVPATLEGYLFPETYETKERVSGVRAAELMVRMWSERMGEGLRGGAVLGDVRLSGHEILTLASIVEREAQQATERPTIAGVYLNRLGRDMRLQADPTTQYAVANKDISAAASFDYWKRDLTVADLQVESPFNTYTQTGLPPGPICNPGEASVRAVLQPAKSDFLYFVARGDGTHLFARTLQEHNANVARVSQ